MVSSSLLNHPKDSCYRSWTKVKYALSDFTLDLTIQYCTLPLLSPPTVCGIGGKTGAHGHSCPKCTVKGREVLRSLQDPGHSTLCEIVELTSRHSCHHVSAQCACLSANAHFTKSKHYYAAFSATCGEITRHRCQTHTGRLRTMRSCREI